MGIANLKCADVGVLLLLLRLMQRHYRLLRNVRVHVLLQPTQPLPPPPRHNQCLEPLELMQVKELIGSPLSQLNGASRVDA